MITLYQQHKGRSAGSGKCFKKYWILNFPSFAADADNTQQIKFVVKFMKLIRGINIFATNFKNLIVQSTTEEWSSYNKQFTLNYHFERWTPIHTVAPEHLQS